MAFFFRPPMPFDFKSTGQRLNLKLLGRQSPQKAFRQLYVVLAGSKFLPRQAEHRTLQ